MVPSHICGGHKLAIYNHNQGDMAMRKLIIPLQFIAVMLSLAFNGYAEEPKERIKNSIGMEFVLIQPEILMMESPEDEPGRYTGENPHAVNLTDPFYLQTTEVTQDNGCR